MKSPPLYHERRANSLPAEGWSVRLHYCNKAANLTMNSSCLVRLFPSLWIISQLLSWWFFVVTSSTHLEGIPKKLRNPRFCSVLCRLKHVHWSLSCRFLKWLPPSESSSASHRRWLWGLSTPSMNRSYVAACQSWWAEEICSFKQQHGGWLRLVG